MIVENKKQISFFFGAGCEGENNFEISKGFEYLKSSLFANEYLENFTDDLSKYFKDDVKKFFDDKIIYRKENLDPVDSTLKNFVLQKSCVYKDFFDNHEVLICMLLSDEELKNITDLYDLENLKHNKQDKDHVSKIKSEFKEIITGVKTLHSEINEKLLKDLFDKNEEGKITCDMNIGMAGILDSYFHTIIDPNKYGSIKFSKIFNYYWACYFTILRDILNFFVNNNQNQFKEYLIYDEERENSKSNDKPKKLNYEKVLRNLHILTQELYNDKFDLLNIAPNNCYYKLIKNELDKNNDKLLCNCVITTNYYRFCEIVAPNAIYLNGKLNYFEYPELLDVSDISINEVKNDKMFFPFIFGQSLVKPIINSMQINEFSKLACNLKNTDILVVLGFAINEDDNHINAFLHEYADQGKTMIIVTDDKKFEYEKKLKCYSKNNIVICKVENYDDTKKVVKQIFKTIFELKEFD